MARRKVLSILFFLFWFAVCESSLKANMVYPLNIFTNKEGYYNSPDLNLYVEVSNKGADQIDFSFYNESSIDSSIARIYFDDDAGSLLDIANIVGLGTSFSQSAAPGNLPGAKLLDPPFEATKELGVSGESPPPENGINPGEWAIITFDLTNGGTFEDVINGLNTGILRIGVHVIDLPNDLRGSAIAVPEPGTLMLLGTVGLIALTRKKSLFEWFWNKSNFTFFGETNSAADILLMKE